MIAKKLNFLVLTDHSGHSKENSIYALLKKLIAHPECGFVDIASRGLEQNKAFFWKNQPEEVWAAQVSKDFNYTEDGSFYRNGIKKVNPADYDIIFLRLPRPVSDEFLNMVDKINEGQLVINDPKGIQETSTKAFLLNFPQFCPAMKLCHSIEEIRQFAQQFPIVLKPLKEYGGRGIVRISEGFVYDQDAAYPLEDYLQKVENFVATNGILAMKFLKNVSQGDKRILVVNGKILAASLRIPAKDSWLCNVAQGGTSVYSEADEEEQKIIAGISPALLENGIVFFGADTLVNDDGKRTLSEVNTLSIGGFPQAEAQTGRPVLQQAIDGIFDFVKSKVAVQV